MGHLGLLWECSMGLWTDAQGIGVRRSRGLEWLFNEPELGASQSPWAQLEGTEPLKGSLPLLKSPVNFKLETVNRGIILGVNTAPRH